MSKIIDVVGNMVEIPPLNNICKHDHNNNIVFIGKMSYEPNIVAVSYFAKEIFPFLKENHPDLNFIIVGATPNKRVSSLRNITGIEVTGFVNSTEKYFRESTIVVAPMLTGAGIQNKIIQAMSYSCCVATSPIGAEGLTINNNEIAIFRDTREWIDGLNALLLNKDDRMTKGDKARSYVEENLSKKKIEKDFMSFINHSFKQIL